MPKNQGRIFQRSTLLGCCLSLSLLSLTACSTLPHSGKVNQSQGVEVANSKSIQNAPAPSRDAEPQEILRGFLAACRAGALTNSFDGARQYLLPRAAAAWKPEAEIHIYPADANIRLQATEATIKLQVPVRGLLSKNGVFQGAGSSEELTANFTFAKDSDDQWRIAQLPSGLILAESTFRSAYNKQSLFFLSPDAKNLVPDVRWVPRAKATSYLAELLLAGPSDELKGAVGTAVPAGATLVSHQVPMDGNEAQVRIQAPDSSLDPVTASLLQWQLDRTLKQESSVLNVAVSINGQVLTSPLPKGEQLAPSIPLAVRNNQVINLSDNSIFVNQLEGAAQPLTGIAIDPRKNQNLAYTRGNTALYWGQLGAQQRNILTGKALTVPDIDRQGWTWIPDLTLGPAAYLVNPEGQVSTIPMPGSGSPVERIVVSPDGMRMLVVRRNQSQAEVALLLIRRETTGRPIETRLLSTTAFAPDTKIWPGWKSPIEPVLLTRTGRSAESTLITLPLGDVQEEELAVSNPIDFAASDSTQGLMLLDQSGSLYRQDGRRWVLLSNGVLWPFYTN
ncbi:hypothetical protein BSR29_06600 [Boudabousia liubingyangii]|uniref:GerMN domain-containing protein n=1 Tax=Boudabousia liubingyangii TaxID=1921764 RepID=A0A1Q5PKX3_9ACTO|nr:LpqB family beta-propeller domain-containing protein [Boudabousia liubingyangii]OKL47282.1 hypothetical protein BSR29_06600 [Boudabousia liubingyangii]